MGLSSLAFGIFLFLYLLVHKPEGPVTGGIEVAMAFTMVAFGSYVVWRRVSHGSQA
jgi:hypothetical protein